jgi:hypothetical protein
MTLMRWVMSLPVGTALSWLMILGMAVVVPVELWQGDYPLALMALLAVGLSLLPGLLRRSYRVVLPWELEFLVVLQLYMHTVLGVWFRFYDSLWFWDKLLHLKGTLIVSFLGFLVAYALHAAGRVRLSRPLLVLFTVCFGNALGAWWEIVEFAVDKGLGKNTQYGLDNTMWDLINNLIGSLVAAALGSLYLRWTRPDERHRLAKPLGQLFGKYIAAAPVPDDGQRKAMQVCDGDERSVNGYSLDEQTGWPGMTAVSRTPRKPRAT